MKKYNSVIINDIIKIGTMVDIIGHQYRKVDFNRKKINIFSLEG